MNLNQLKYFYTVCTYGSLSDAAEYLYISQPSLSSAIKALENEFGVSLFIRKHQGMELTKEGKMLCELCQDVLLRTEKLENIMKDMGKERNRLRLGIPPMIGSLILPYIYCDFCKLHPDITLEIVEGGRGELMEKLEENYLDMIFSIQNKPFDAKYESISLSRLEIVCCASENNPISKLASVSPADLKDVPLVLFGNKFFQTEEIKKWFAMEKIAPDIILQTDQLSTMLTMISNNVSVGFAFRELTEANNGFVAIPTQKSIYVDASLVWNKEAYEFSGMEKFRKYIVENNPFCKG